MLQHLQVTIMFFLNVVAFHLITFCSLNENKMPHPYTVMNIIYPHTQHTQSVTYLLRHVKQFDHVTYVTSYPRENCCGNVVYVFSS